MPRLCLLLILLARGTKMPLEWMRHHNVFTDLTPSNTDFVAFDGDRIIGRVMQYVCGRESGLWLWSVVATAPGVTILPNSGRCNTRGEAGRCLVAAYERLLARPRLGADGGEDDQSSQ
jgi:hypothetical protein